MNCSEIRDRFVLGNWKMHGSLKENATFLELLRKIKFKREYSSVGICVPFPYLAQTQAILGESQISWGAQDLSIYPTGPYTGEVSASMLKDFNCQWVLVGHSERRKQHGETNEVVTRKAIAAHLAHLTPVICLGESISERESGQTLKVIEKQLFGITESASNLLTSHMFFAYEPLWAIGTGYAAELNQIREVHHFIRTTLYKAGVCRVSVLYGGSVQASNIADLLSVTEIDGVLVGSSSLIANEFIQIATT